ncbi:hypothetical protein VTI74DRAFT_7540 [Chaetomium olivicolor]
MYNCLRQGDGEPKASQQALQPCERPRENFNCLPFIQSTTAAPRKLPVLVQHDTRMEMDFIELQVSPGLPQLHSKLSMQTSCGLGAHQASRPAWPCSSSATLPF